MLFYGLAGLLLVSSMFLQNNAKDASICSASMGCTPLTRVTQASPAEKEQDTNVSAHASVSSAHRDYGGSQACSLWVIWYLAARPDEQASLDDRGPQDQESLSYGTSKGSAQGGIPTHYQGLRSLPQGGVEAIIQREFESRGLDWRYAYEVMMCESRGERYTIGTQGEVSYYQLHPQGKLATFFALGYTDPFDPEQHIRFVAETVAAEGWGAWACAGLY